MEELRLPGPAERIGVLVVEIEGGNEHHGRESVEGGVAEDLLQFGAKVGDIVLRAYHPTQVAHVVPHAVLEDGRHPLVVQLAQFTRTEAVGEPESEDPSGGGTCDQVDSVAPTLDPNIELLEQDGGQQTPYSSTVDGENPET